MHVICIIYLKECYFHNATTEISQLHHITCVGHMKCCFTPTMPLLTSSSSHALVSPPSPPLHLFILNYYCQMLHTLTGAFLLSLSSFSWPWLFDHFSIRMLCLSVKVPLLTLSPALLQGGETFMYPFELGLHV